MKPPSVSSSKRIALVVIVTLLVAVSAQSQQGAEPPPAVDLPGTQLLKFTSTVVPSQQYVLQVQLPRDYADTAKTFPVVYVLDGQWDFSLVTALYGQQFYDGFVPNLIIVGITWGGDHPNVDSLRARDYTPSHSEWLPQSGGANRFLLALKNEIIPFIEKRFRASHADRTLMGCSFGGLFTVSAMFHETALFNRYIAASPSISWNDSELLSEEKAYAEASTDLPVRLFMVIGEYENVGVFKSFADLLRSRGYPGLRLETRVLENTGHSGSKGEGFARGLQFVFARPSLAIDTTVLARYCGQYEVNPDTRVTMFVDNGHLTGRTPDGQVLTLHAESEEDFYVKGMYLNIHFRKDESGAVTGFQAKFFNGEQFAKRIQ